MRNLIKVPVNGLCFLLPVLFIISCNTPDNKPVENAHSVDTVVIKLMQFSPAQLHVKIGDTVVWINKDIVDHNVTEEKNKSFYSDTLAVGKSWKMVVKDSADYFCSLHPSMKGSLVLE